MDNLGAEKFMSGIRQGEGRQSFMTGESRDGSFYGEETGEIKAPTPLVKKPSVYDSSTQK